MSDMMKDPMVLRQIIMDHYQYLVINDDLDTCVKEVHQLIQSEHLKVSENLDLVADIHRHLPVVKKRPAEAPGAPSNLLYILRKRVPAALQNLLYMPLNREKNPNIN